MNLAKLDVVSLLFLRRRAVTGARLFGDHGGERAYSPDLWARVLAKVEAVLTALGIPFGDVGPARDLEDAILFLLVPQYPEQQAANEALVLGVG